MSTYVIGRIAGADTGLSKPGPVTPQPAGDRLRLVSRGNPKKAFMNIRKKSTASQKEATAKREGSQTGRVSFHSGRGFTIVDVLQIFPGAKIIERSAEQQFELIEKKH
jgi:hypothetical protein